MSKDTGGPAFPHVMRRISEDISEQITGGGMTLRDWFAGQALTGMLGWNHKKMKLVEWAADAYALADAMIAERSKP